MLLVKKDVLKISCITGNVHVLHRLRLFIFFHKNVVNKKLLLLKKLRKFITGFLRPTKADKSYNFNILIFTQAHYLLYLVCVDLLC